MNEGLFKVVFKGEIGFDFDEDEVKDNLQQMSGLSRERIDRLFSGKCHTLKKDVDRETALRFREALVNAGALAEIEPMAAPAAETIRQPPPKAASSTPFRCPACGHEQEAGEACVACGVFFAKYEAARKRREQALQESLHSPSPGPADVAPEPSPRPRSRFDLGSSPAGQALLVAAAAALIQIYFACRHLEVVGFILLTTIFLLVLLFSPILRGEELLEGVSGQLGVEVERYLRVDRRRQWWPYKVTYGLVVVNVLLYYGVVIHLSAATLSDYLALLPVRPTIWSVPLSLLAAPLLHASGGQLWGGVLFLWATGMVLEPRLGGRRFFCCYLALAMLAGGLGSLLNLVLFGEALHGFGPAGAIAGLFGICFAAGIGPVLKFPLPLLGALPLVYPLGFEARFPLLALLGFFLYAGLAGGLGPAHSFQAAFGGQLVNGIGLLSGMLLGRLIPVATGPDSSPSN